MTCRGLERRVNHHITEAFSAAHMFSFLEDTNINMVFYKHLLLHYMLTLDQELLTLRTMQQLKWHLLETASVIMVHSKLQLHINEILVLRYYNQGIWKMFFFGPV